MAEVEGMATEDTAAVPPVAPVGPSPKRRFLLEVFYLSQLAITVGAVAGLIWGLVAPREQVTVVDSDHLSYDPMSSAPIGADMTFMLIAIVCAFITVFVAFKIAFSDPLRSFIGVMVGSILGTLMMFLIGYWVGNMNNADPAELAVGESTNTPLGITATGVFLAWPFWAALLTAIGCWLRARKHESVVISPPAPN